MTSESVLIVDDSLTVRMDLAEAFVGAGFRPRPCGSLADARKVMSQETVALAILDVMLPDGDGIEMLQEIRTKLGDGVPVLMLSSEAEVRDRIRGLQTGANDYVGKPYDTIYVIARARELIKARQQTPVPASNRHCILVIDDSVTFREQVRVALQEAGMHVVVAGSGEEGLRLAALHRPAAMLVDGIMPGMDGAEFIRRVRIDSALRGIPCLLLTASEDKGSELRALEAGADSFVRKDEDLGVLVARVTTLLRSKTPNPADTQSLMGPKRILAVDDSPTYLQELSYALHAEGYDVVLARSGEDALSMLNVQSVDCVLLDLLMPGISGMQTCKQIRQTSTTRDVPLIMITSMEDRQSMIEGLVSGADDFISKSSEMPVVMARVRSQLRRKQFEDEHRKIRDDLLRSELEATEARAAKEIAESRAALAEELERKNRELEAFSYSVSHDLRAPLRAIQGFTQALAEDHASTLNQEGKDYLRRVTTAADRMSTLIEDLMELSRVSRAELKRTSINLSDLVASIASDLQQRDSNRTVAVSCERGITIHADPNLLRVLLENLIGNAWKFTSKIADPKIEVGSTTADGTMTYFVRDNGAGFDMAYAERLFSPFQRLHHVSDFPGTGVGLATCYRIVDRHGGRIWAEGKVNDGATFSFTMPSATSSRS